MADKSNESESKAVAFALDAQDVVTIKAPLEWSLIVDKTWACDECGRDALDSWAAASPHRRHKGFRTASESYRMGRDGVTPLLSAGLHYGGSGVVMPLTGKLSAMLRKHGVKEGRAVSVKLYVTILDGDFVGEAASGERRDNGRGSALPRKLADIDSLPTVTTRKVSEADRAADAAEAARKAAASGTAAADGPTAAEMMRMLGRMSAELQALRAERQAAADFAADIATESEAADIA